MYSFLLVDYEVTFPSSHCCPHLASGYNDQHIVCEPVLHSENNTSVVTISCLWLSFWSFFLCIISSQT